ncbi:unnamed protein product [Closterium sp. NIES-65]|nr:unnamed protein product [Closterium sp. NIES-65]
MVGVSDDRAEHYVNLESALLSAPAILEADDHLSRIFSEFVPRLVSEREFWKRYFYVVAKVELELEHEEDWGAADPSPLGSPASVGSHGRLFSLPMWHPKERDMNGSTCSTTTSVCSFGGNVDPPNIPSSVLLRNLAQAVSYSAPFATLKDLVAHNGKWPGTALAQAVGAGIGRAFSLSSISNVAALMAELPSEKDMAQLWLALVEQVSCWNHSGLRQTRGAALVHSVHGSYLDSFVAQVAAFMAELLSEKGMAQLWLALVEQVSCWVHPVDALGAGGWAAGDPVSAALMAELPSEKDMAQLWLALVEQVSCPVHSTSPLVERVSCWNHSGLRSEQLWLAQLWLASVEQLRARWKQGVPVPHVGAGRGGPDLRLCELRVRWKQGVPVPHVAAGRHGPDLRLCEVMQHLQLLNCCIARQRRRKTIGFACKLPGSAAAGTGAGGGVVGRGGSRKIRESLSEGAAGFAVTAGAAGVGRPSSSNVRAVLSEGADCGSDMSAASTDGSEPCDASKGAVAAGRSARDVCLGGAEEQSRAEETLEAQWADTETLNRSSEATCTVPEAGGNAGMESCDCIMNSSEEPPFYTAARGGAGGAGDDSCGADDDLAAGPCWNRDCPGQHLFLCDTCSLPCGNHPPVEHTGQVSPGAAPGAAAAEYHLDACYARVQSGRRVLRRGVKEQSKSLRLLETGEPLCIPVTQDGPLMTESSVRESEELIMRTKSHLSCRASSSSPFLPFIQPFSLSPLSFSPSLSFIHPVSPPQAANPGCVLEDFVRWYSPPDWSPLPQSPSVHSPSPHTPSAKPPTVQTPTLDSASLPSPTSHTRELASEAKTPCAATCAASCAASHGREKVGQAAGSAAGGRIDSTPKKTGYLSVRMKASDNLWQQLWNRARPLPIALQPPLVDYDYAACSSVFPFFSPSPLLHSAREKSLTWLESIPPSHLFAELFTALVVAGFSAAASAYHTPPTTSSSSSLPARRQDGWVRVNGSDVAAAAAWKQDGEEEEEGEGEGEGEGEEEGEEEGEGEACVQATANGHIRARVAECCRYVAGACTRGMSDDKITNVCLVYEMMEDIVVGPQAKAQLPRANTSASQDAQPVSTLKPSLLQQWQQWHSKPSAKPHDNHQYPPGDAHPIDPLPENALLSNPQPNDRHDNDTHQNDKEDDNHACSDSEPYDTRSLSDASCGTGGFSPEPSTSPRIHPPANTPARRFSILGAGSSFPSFPTASFPTSPMFGSIDLSSLHQYNQQQQPPQQQQQQQQTIQQQQQVVEEGSAGQKDAVEPVTAQLSASSSFVNRVAMWAGLGAAGSGRGLGGEQASAQEQQQVQEQQVQEQQLQKQQEEESLVITVSANGGLEAAAAAAAAAAADADASATAATTATTATAATAVDGAAADAPSLPVLEESEGGENAGKDAKEEFTDNDDGEDVKPNRPLTAPAAVSFRGFRKVDMTRKLL